MRAERFPLGAGVTIAGLEADPYALLARLRASEPVSWLPAIDGWLVTRRDLALAAMRDAEAFTVDDPRFTTAQVVGREHALARRRRARPPPRAVRRAGCGSARCAGGWPPRWPRRPNGWPASWRRAARASCGASFAGPLAAAAVTRALGLDGAATGAVLGWYDAIVAAVTDLSAGRPAGAEAARAVAELGEAVRPALRSGGGLGGHRAERRRGHLERRGAAVRRHRDDRGDDRQRGRAPARAPRGARRRARRSRRCCRRRSRSRCGSSPPRP